MKAVELTKKLVAINSVNPFTTVEVSGKTIGIGNEGPIHEYLEALLKERGFHTQRQVFVEEQTVEVNGQAMQIPARWNLLAERGEGAKSLLFFGHTDTVDVKVGWQTDPFTATEKVVDGQRRLYGLGANDMKSGLAAVIAGIPETLPAGVKIKLAFLADEEYWSFGASALLETNFLDDVCLAIVPEIGESRVSASAQQIGLGRLGREEFVFSIKGSACHGADAFVNPDAVNAVHESVKLQYALIEYCRSAKKTFRESGVEAVNAAYINYQQGGRGMLSVPDTAECYLDRSFVPGESVEEELKTLERLVKQLQESGSVDPRAEIHISRRPRPTTACKPYFFSRDLPAIATLESLIKSAGDEVEYFIGRSVADENRLAERGIPTAILSPVGEGSHTSSEWVDISSIERLERLIAAVCATDALCKV